MKTVVIIVIVLVVVALVVLAILAVVLGRAGRRGWQRYTGLERQRDSAKQSRVTGADRLKRAERNLIEAQRALVERNELAGAQIIEVQRKHLSTLADRLRYATYGYSPMGSNRPVREQELADLQQRDADTIADAQAIVELTEAIRTAARGNETPDLGALTAALEDLSDSLDRRRAVS
jgi:hypothetical protein